MTATKLVIGVPARNEAERLPRLLDALARQTTQDFVVVLALNNTSDNSREVIADACRLNPQLKVITDETCIAPANAHAGSARRRAMDLAAEFAGPDGVVLTTDADTRPPPNWVAQNMSAMASDLDIVGGKIVLDDDEPILSAVARLRHCADLYWARVREIEDAIDPVPWDPQPRHGDHTGASLCIRVAAYRLCGGVPLVRTGEDRALVQAVLRHGGRLAHPIGIWTRVSPRVDGRAAGGMADHMLRLQNDSAANLDSRLPSFAQWHERALWRRDIRAQGGSALIAELEDGLPPMIDDMVLDERALGSVP